MKRSTPIPNFRYDTTGTWLKGNAHIHSTLSDGGKTAAKLGEMYAAAGYDFLFHADHWVVSDAGAEDQGAPLLWLDGIELDGRDYLGASYHVVCLGTFTGLDSKMGLVAGMEAARAQGGLLILAHPHWMGNTLDDALRWGFDGVEVYNHVCHWLNGKGDSRVYWNAMLAHFGDTLSFAVDDAHVRPEHPGWNGGWTMVNVADRSRQAIISAIRRGNFYSSCGPEIHSIESDGASVTVRTSPVQFVRLAGPGTSGRRIGSFDGELRTEATFEVPADWRYAYLEVEDDSRRRAWTNNLFPSD